MKNNFLELGLNKNLVDGLLKENISSPTDIQDKAIPLILDNKDIVGQSETGTGKTLAFLLPLFEKIDTQSKDLQYIILSPTHELCVQIQNEIKKLAKNSQIDVRSNLIIGNVNIKRQIENLKEKPHIIVGSSGRILELIGKRKIKCHNVKCIVIDEADKMLNKHNIDNVKKVIKSALRDTQILMFSATITENTLELGNEILKNPEIVRIKTKEIVNSDISHIYFECEYRDKIKYIRKIISSVNPKRAILFINSGFDVENLVEKLNFHSIKTVGLHGKSLKLERKKAIDDFAKGKANILISTDMSARGLDIKDVTHIINFDIPDNPKDYLHRVGRAGRAGEKGVAISLISEREKQFIDRFQKAYNIKIKLKDIYNGKIIDVR